MSTSYSVDVCLRLVEWLWNMTNIWACVAMPKAGILAGWLACLLREEKKSEAKKLTLNDYSTVLVAPKKWMGATN